MNTQPVERFHGTHARRGNCVHNRQVRDRNPQRLAFAYRHECLMQNLASISQAPMLAEPATTTDAKKTLHVRKFPKREQKIIVAYKGDISEIKKNFAPIGRL